MGESEVGGGGIVHCASGGCGCGHDCGSVRGIVVLQGLWWCSSGFVVIFDGQLCAKALTEVPRVVRA